MKKYFFLVLLLCATIISQGAIWYVDPSGTDDGSHGTTTGTGAFKTIQYAINAAAASDVIRIATGTYLESNILVGKSLIIEGVGATRDDVVVAPAIYDGNEDDAFNVASNGFVIKANDVTIRKLTINGNGNPALTLHGNNYRAGIVTLDASQPGGGAWNNLLVDNVFIKNAWRRGISVFPRNVIGTIIQNSRIENIAYNQGLYLAGQSQVINNTIKHCFQGVVQNPDVSTPIPSGLFKINNNILTEIGNFAGCYGYPNGQPRAIQFDPVDPTFRMVEIKNNVIDDIGSIGNAGTVGIYTRRANSSSLIENNTITLTSGTSHGGGGGAQAVGMLLGWSYTNGFMVRINHVTMTGYGLGVLIFGSGTSSDPMILEGNVLTSSASLHTAAGDGTGVYIANQYLYGSSNKNEVYVLIQNHNTITGFAKGIDLDKIVTPLYPITVIAHMNSLVGNAIGIDASTMGATVDVIDNWWGNSAGPYHPVLNPSGTPSTVATDFDSFIPWWCDAAMTGKCSPMTGSFVIMNLSTGVKYTSSQLALALTVAASGQTLFIDGIADATTINISPKTITIVGTGIPGESVISGASTLTSGNLIVKNIEFTNTTNTPTILVTGGTLNLRSCVINETSGGNQAGLKVTGGIVDAGTLADYGLNKFVVSSPGSAIENGLSLTPANKWYAIGNNWGNPTGPSVSTNPGGTGGAILNSVLASTDYVIYRPWGGISLSGNFTYYNLYNTPLTDGITVKLYQNDVQVGLDYNVTAGSYSFANLVMGDYEVRTTSVKPTTGSVNATDAAQVNYWGAHPYSIEKVRFYAGDVTGETFYINATDALRIQKNFVYGTAFDRPSWTFWETGKTIITNSSPTESYPIVTIGGGSNKTANMYGLCTGDFNRSLIPGAKSANSSVILNYAGTIQVNPNQDFDLPVRMVNASVVGAISLILNFPADLVEVKDVVMNSTGGQLDWNVAGNELRIGWNSQTPATLAALDNLLTLRLKASNSFTKGNTIKFALVANPLNELADDHYDVIGNAILNVDVVEASPNGIAQNTAGNGIAIRNYPNPFTNSTLISYTLPENGTVRLEIRNALGLTVKILVAEFQSKGDHSINFEAAGLAAGVYTATIRLSSKTEEFSNTIKIINNR